MESKEKPSQDFSWPGVGKTAGSPGVQGDVGQILAFKLYDSGQKSTFRQGRM